MLDRVEVTVAVQPLPRLQAVGSAEAVFPFLYEISWGPHESFSAPRLRRHVPGGCDRDALDQDGRRDQWGGPGGSEPAPPPIRIGPIAAATTRNETCFLGPHVAAWASRNEHNGLALAELARASRWATDPQATVQLPLGSQPPA